MEFDTNHTVNQLPKRETSKGAHGPLNSVSAPNRKTGLGIWELFLRVFHVAAKGWISVQNQCYTKRYTKPKQKNKNKI